MQGAINANRNRHQHLDAHALAECNADSNYTAHAYPNSDASHHSYADHNFHRHRDRNFHGDADRNADAHSPVRHAAIRHGGLVDR